MSKNYEPRAFQPNKAPNYQQPCQPHIPYGGPSPYPYMQPTNVNPNTSPGQMPQPGTMQGANVSDIPGMLPIERSYIENILRLNKGKIVTVYMTFENNTEWNAKTFHGRIEAAGRDHLIISDPSTNERYLLLMVYLDYVEFDEPINYEYPLGSTMPEGMLSQYNPR